MNTEMDSFENKLRNIKPSSTSAKLMTKLLATRPQPAEVTSLPDMPAGRKLNWYSLIFRTATPLAAAALAMLAFKTYIPGCSTLQNSHPQPQASQLQVRPAESVDCILGAREIGTYQAPNGDPYKVVQCVGLKQDIWENMKDGTRVAQTTPRQRVLLVSMNTY